jgi:hypothetical protein
VESTLVGPPFISLRGAVEAARLDRSAVRSLLLAYHQELAPGGRAGGDLQSLTSLRSGDSGAREARREGDHASCVAFAPVLSAGALRRLRRRAPLSRHVTSVARAREGGTAVSLPTEVRQLVRGCARASDTLQKPAGVARPRDAKRQSVPNRTLDARGRGLALTRSRTTATSGVRGRVRAKQR